MTMGKTKVLKGSFNQFVYLNFYTQSVLSLEENLKCKPDLMLSCQCYEQYTSDRERNIKLLIASATYTAITETVTCILQEKQLCTTESTTCIVAIEPQNLQN